MVYKTIEIEQDYPVSTLWLNRPEVRNAFNEMMIGEITDAVMKIGADEQTKVMILRGKGTIFCSGANLNWMKNVAHYNLTRNLEESLNLSKCLRTLYSCPKPTIAIAHGAAMGGANGLLAACDIVLAETDTIFSFSEVRMGLIPSCISPYVIKRIGEYSSRELMLTGRRFDAKEAEKFKLVNYTLNHSELQVKLNEILEDISLSGQCALRECKDLIRKVSDEWTFEDTYAKTADLIARIRVSKEGQEGMSAFLEKRKPNWIDE